MVIGLFDDKIELCNGISTRATIVNGRIWSVLGNNITRYSDDFGDTFVDIPNDLPFGTTDYYVHMTSTGAMIVSRGNGIYRAVAPYTTFTQVTSFSTTGSILREWAFTEDNDNVLYIAEYGNYVDTVNGGYVNIMYWYKSLDDGLTWTRYTNLYDVDNKHIHMLQVNPFTNDLYVTTGDGLKLMFKSTDKGESWQEIIPDEYPSKTSENIEYGGFTGINFFSTGEIIYGTDWQPRDPETGKYWNWFVRSMGDDTSTFVYEKIEHEYYGMCSSLVNEQYGSRAWMSLKDEFMESDVKPVMMYTEDKGVNWNPLVELPADDVYNAGRIINPPSDFSTTTNPYIFWEVTGYGVVRFPKSLSPIPTDPPITTNGTVKNVSMFMNVGGVIKEVDLYNKNSNVIQSLNNTAKL